MRRALIPLACVMIAASASAAVGHTDHGQKGGQSHHHQRQEVFPDPTTVTEPDGVSVTDCWIRAMPNRLPAAAYFRITNASKQEAVLVGARAEGFGKVMLHTHDDTGGMAKMAHVDKVIVPAEGRFDFSPRGHHVMLERALVDLDIGSRRDVTLWFEGPKAITVSCAVRPPGTLK